jgi:hypothetical protein
MAPKSSKGVKCAGCNTKIDSKEPVVEALHKKYHKNCFACTNCSKTIDGNFHPVNEKPWCNECYLEKIAPRCEDCRKPITGTIVKTDDGRIFHEDCSKNLQQGSCDACKSTIGFTEPVVEALGGKYHKDCFVCAKCQGPVPDKFHAENGKPWCDNCHQQKIISSSPICNECNKPITKGTRLEVAGRVFHEACFSHAGWGPCGGCNQKVLLSEPSIRVTALNRYWHLGCLNCDGCNHNIRSPFYMKSDRPCCESCYLGRIAPKCHGCAQPIADQQVKALNAFWHPDCFVCAVCHDMLHLFGKEFFNVEGKPYCKRDLEAAGIPVVG